MGCWLNSITLIINNVFFWSDSSDDENVYCRMSKTSKNKPLACDNGYTYTCDGTNRFHWKCTLSHSPQNCRARMITERVHAEPLKHKIVKGCTSNDHNHPSSPSIRVLELEKMLLQILERKPEVLEIDLLIYNSRDSKRFQYWCCERSSFARCFTSPDRASQTYWKSDKRAKMKCTLMYPG